MKIAITGTMASGKSLCSNYLRQLGYYVFDSDLYAKECYKKTHPAYNHIVNLLGNNMLDDEGNFVFKKVAELIFKNKELKKELESIIHPYVKEEILKQSKEHEPFFSEVPLLFEAKWDSLFDYILLITSDEDLIIKRSMENRNYSKEEVLNRLSSQLEVKHKIERSNYVLYNNKTVEEFKDSIYKWLVEMNLVNDAVK